MFFRRWILACCLLVSVASAPISAEEASWQINLKDADMEAFISQVADITGKSFVLDPRVKGKVNVVSNEPMSQESVYELFLSVLQIHGLAALPAGDVTLIIQQNDVKTSGRSLEIQADSESQELLTKVIMIKNVPALDLVPILRSMVAKYGHLAGVKSANALIITDHAVNINRIEEIIERLDRSGNQELEVIQLKEAWVGNVVSMLQNLDPSKVANGNSDGGKIAGSIRVVADERSNRLILKGESTARARIRALIEDLDQPSYFSGSAQVIRLRYADATKMAEMINSVMNSGGGSAASKDEEQLKGDVGVHADEDLNALVVKAEPSVMKEIQELVASLDVRRAQVLIESAIVEVTGDVTDALGVQWITGNDTDDLPIGLTNFNTAGSSLTSIAAGVATNNPAALGNGLTLGAYKSEGNGGFGAIIQALTSSSSTNLLSTPSIMTLDNQEAEIIVGQNVPFITGSTSSSTNANPFTTVTREDVGVTLKVKPHIHDGEDIRLEVEATTESVAQTTVEGSADLITNKRSLKTMILSNDQETIVLGGLIRDDVIQVQSKVPVLGSIPLLGWLFRSQSENHVKSNLLIFLRPTIVNDPGKATELTEEKFNGIWEFSVSDQLGIDSTSVRLNNLFEGLPVREDD